MHHPLSLIELPDRIEQLYTESKNLSRQFMDLAFPTRSIRALARDNDLDRLFADCFIWIEKGIFKSTCNGRSVRWYSDGDIVTPTHDPAGASGRSTVSQFGSSVTVITQQEFLDAVSPSRPAQELYIRRCTVESEVLAGLCAALIPEGGQPDIACREYSPGQVIIAEGDPSGEIYQMVDGSGDVFANGTKVGEVRSGEIFGEISFLTGEPRSATVIARSRSLVQVMREEDFLHVTRFQPRTSLEVSRILARRLLEVNRRLIGGLT